MPELPEVETTCRGITPHIKGQTIATITIRQPKLRWPVSEQLHSLNNIKIVSVHRRAKYILLELAKGWIIIHLGMSGRLRILTQSEPVEKHDHIDLQCQNGTILRYTDPRRFGAWLWSDNLENCTVLQKLGPEPLSTDFTAEYLFKLSRNKRVPIKSWIMDNHVVVGVGNIYANESLFMAKILPQHQAGALSLQQYECLVEKIRFVLKRSIKQGGTTLKDFLQSDGKPGYFAQQLLVYGKKGEQCSVCGHPLQDEKIGQRSTFFCLTCQK